MIERILTVVLSCLAAAALAIAPLSPRSANASGVYITTVSAPPTVASGTSPTQFFTGDLTGTVAHLHNITGAVTLGHPINGYMQTVETSGEIEGCNNTSGHNQLTSRNGGRTGVACRYYKLWQYGQGDFTATECFGNVFSTLSGATSYLAGPEVGCVGGQLGAFSSGSYVEFLGDLDINDNNYDIGSAIEVGNINRTVAIEAEGANHVFHIHQSIGTAPVDSDMRTTGPLTMGIDYSSANLSFYRLAGYSITAGGSGYATGDILKVSGGTTGTPAGTPTVFTVSSVSSGAITGLTVTNTGIYNAPPVNQTSYYRALTITTSGPGAGAAISGQYDKDVAWVLPTAGGCIKPAISKGQPYSLLGGIYSEICDRPGGVLLGGGPGNSITAATGANNVVLGSRNLAAGASNSLVHGDGASDEASQNCDTFASGSFAKQGDAQTRRCLYRATVSTSAATRLTSSNAVASTNTSWAIFANEELHLHIRATAVDVITGDRAIWRSGEGSIYRGSHGAVGAYAGDFFSATPPDPVLSTPAGMTALFIVSANTTANDISVSFTRPAGNTDTWRVLATLDGDEILTR